MGSPRPVARASPERDSRARRPRRTDRGRARPQRARRRVGARELVVGQLVHERSRPRHDESELYPSVRSWRPRARAWQAPTAMRAASPSLRVAHSAPRPVVHRLVSRAVELAERQLDQQLDGLDRGRLRQVAKSAHQTRVGLLVSPELTLHRGAGRHDRRAEGARVLRDDRDRLLQRLMAVGEMAGRRQRPGTGEQKLDALLRRRGPGSNRSAPPNQRAALSGASRAVARPHRGGRRRLRCRPGAPTARRGARAAAVALAPRALPRTARGHQVASRQRYSSYTARRTSGCRKRKRRGTSVERMRSSSRSSSTACIAAASDVAAAAAASSGSNGSPATAAPSSRRRPPSDSSASSSLSAAATAAGLRGRSRDLGSGGGSTCALARPRAARGRRGCHRSPGRGRLRRRRRSFRPEALELHRASERPSSSRVSAAARCARSRAAARASGSGGAERHCREHGRCGRPAQQRTEQLDRARVSPVEVVEHEDQRPRLRETLEQRAHRSVLR